MAFLDKLKFWKKEDVGTKFAELDQQLGTAPIIPGSQVTNPNEPYGPEMQFGEPIEEPLMRSADSGLNFPSREETGMQGFGMEHPAEKRGAFEVRPAYEQQQAMPVQGQNTQQQLELIAAKLDTIRVSLESINHRLVAVERALHAEEYEGQPMLKRRRGVW